MKLVIKVFLLIVLTTLLCGFGYKEYRELTTPYETNCYHERVRVGDTFSGICSQYYNPENERDSWDEWLTKQKLRNKKLFFYSNGKPRWLAPNDIVCIEVREKIKDVKND